MGQKQIQQIVSSYFRRFQLRINILLAYRKFVRYSNHIKGRVLDVGAGDQPYRRCFPGTEEYVATNTRGSSTQADSDALEKFTDVWIDDATSLPFEDSSFDGLLCFQVLSVIDRPQEFFTESARVLRKDGILMLATDFLYPKWAKEDVMRHTDRHLVQMAEEAGFDVVVLESFGGIYSMAHCCFARYFRDYPQQISLAKNPVSKGLRLLMLLFYMLLTPLFSGVGWLIYLAERNVCDNFKFTTNCLLIARKRVGAAPVAEA